jgi:hypothetical protein
MSRWSLVALNALAAALNLGIYFFMPDASVWSLIAGVTSIAFTFYFWRRKPVHVPSFEELGLFRVDNMTDPWFGAQQGAGFLHTHPREKCEGQVCVIHNPSDHEMRDWPMNWRADRKLMERLCLHGVGHPDPDDLAFHIREGRPWQSGHGCDGCCHA